MTDPDTDTDDEAATEQPDDSAGLSSTSSSPSGGQSVDRDGRTAGSREPTANRDDRVAGRETDGTDRRRESGRDLVSYVEWAAFGILCLLALVATFRFYFAASEAIRVWFSADFVPVFQAVFNLLVLVASAVGISVLVRRIA